MILSLPRVSCCTFILLFGLWSSRPGHAQGGGLSGPALSASQLENKLHPSGEEPLNPIESQRSRQTVHTASFPLPQIFVLDTAIVLSTTDTSRHLYSYSPACRMIGDLTQKYKKGLWTDIQRWTNTYDASGNVIAYLIEGWSGTQWANVRRTTFTFDDDGKPTSFLAEQFLDSQWVNLTRSTITSDSNNTQMQMSERWSSGQWVNDRRWTDTLDAYGNRLVELLEIWSNGQWANSIRSNFTYQSDGKQIFGLTEQWTSGQWVRSNRTTSRYGLNGKLASFLLERWINSNWANGGLSSYTYDVNGLLTIVEYADWFPSTWSPANSSFQVRDSAGNTYPFFSAWRVMLHYKRLLTGIESQRGSIPATFNLSQNYPNPFNPTTTIHYSLPNRSLVWLAVYNTLGQQVAELVNGQMDAGYHDVTFNAVNLPSGMYFYRLQAGSYNETRKLVVIK